MSGTKEPLTLTSALRGTSAIISCVGLVSVAPAAAQGGGTHDAVSAGDIVVTARKRDETSLSVPVVVSAVGGAELQQRGIASLDGLATIVPALMIGSTGGSVQGGNVVIRGLAGADSNPFADQAVSFNVDGVQVARANIRRMAEMDTAQIEVLKGPQALFFGKNSPSGIISIRSADPTATFQAKASLGYEFNARELRGEGFVSGPLTDTLGARLAVYASGMRGWMDNEASGATGIYAPYAPDSKHLPRSRDFATRGTLKWEPNDRFNAQLKVSYARVNDTGLLSSQEKIDCPGGGPAQGGGPEDCRPNGHMARLNLGPVLGTLAPEFGNGEPYFRQRQVLVSHEMNYDLTDTLSLTSVTGYYWLKARFADDFNLAYDRNAALAATIGFGTSEFSEELRLTSDFDGMVNFMVGGFYQKSKTYSGAESFIGLVTPRQINNYFLRQNGEAFSVFGQAMIKPIDVIEISVGGRYSHEKKALPVVNSGLGLGEPPAVPINPLFPRKDKWNNFSPEFTVSYRPTDKLTVFASYKKGFLSGGFNAGSTNFNSDLRFDQQLIKGFESGIKASLLDGMLRTNLSAYSYKVAGLQITTSETTDNGNIQRVTNAGKVSVKGFEFDATLRTRVGLTLRGAVAYNDGTYDRFSIGCYRGQTQALGCNAGAPSAAGIYSTQNLDGARLVKAPKWTGSAGVGYETTINDTLRFGANVDTSFSSGYFSDATNKPASWQDNYGMLDANIRLATADDRYEIALIGRNLTDKYYVQRTLDSPLGGSAPGGLTGVLADTQGSVNRGRQIMLRLTARYGG
ncbi:TonB-dependent receptor [Sphingobium sp. 3R8]|uniref:TonB-dependent receptor n=1 Tax=Sphingobium sp. 3R8 TaxID=2874921 RepID=UPI001CCA524B|nr:TonB-dependent receptor [Sphingobium sp. 3R8]MBZ9649886.1 TonB-dependent receptor [Sphingobium sp. 3R8]